MNRRGLLLGAAALGGCRLGPVYERPPLDLPPEFQATAASGATVWPALDWWRGFGSDELNQLMDRARDYNTDLVAAAARVYQADAQLRISGAPLLPAVNGTGTFNYQRTGTGSSRSGSSGLLGGGSRYSDFRSYGTQLQASYDLDFWGRNRAAYEASAALAVANRFDQETVALTVVASVANTYVQVLGAQDRLVVALGNLRQSEQILAAYQGRLAAGISTALDVSQQQALVAGQRATLPAFANTIAQQTIALGIMVGTPPERLHLKGGGLTLLKLPEVAAGLPSELLRRRPDVAYAEAQLLAANANIRVARAAFFPDVTLTGSGGLVSTMLSSLTGPGTLAAALAAALTQPIFDNGLRRGQLEVAKGRYAELVADYVKAILQSFTDVEQALTALRYSAEQQRLEEEAIKVAQRSSDIASAQLKAGTIDIITSLNTQSTLFNDQDLLTQIRLARFQNLIAVYKALGGGFQGGIARI